MRVLVDFFAAAQDYRADQRAAPMIHKKRYNENDPSISLSCGLSLHLVMVILEDKLTAQHGRGIKLFAR